MTGILCEKPSAARNFAKALGGSKGTFDGTEYVIVNTVGHVYEFKKPAEQVDRSLEARYKSWNLSNLPWNENDFQWKREKKSGAEDVLRTLKSVLGKCDEIVMAGDVDASGEGGYIDAEIIWELKLKPKKLTRMYFVDESAPELRKAFKNRKAVPDLARHDEILKADFRSKWDFMSMQWSRIATACGDGKSVLRQGRLKSAMVLIVGDQLKKIAEYKKVPFYQNRFRDENGVVYTNPEEPQFPDKKQVPATYHVSKVVLDNKAMKSSAPPKLMDLAALSSVLAGKGHKAKTVLAVYQKMYEDQIVSYPRTDDKTITPEQFNDLLPHVDAIARVAGVDPAVLTHRRPRPTHVKEGGSHGANRPGPNVPSSLSALSSYGACAADIYVVLAKSFLAMLCEDYEYEAQKGHVADYPKFTGSASVPKKAGWKAVLGGIADDDDEDVNAKGPGTTADPFVHEGFPPKPASPTMKWLMKQLEKYDVGTGATRTSTYADVTSDKAKFPLLTDKRGKIGMTEYGEMSYTLLPGTHIGDLKVTERVQRQMADIAAGKTTASACLNEIQAMILDDIEIMRRNGAGIKKGASSGMEGIEKEYAQGKWNGKDIRFNRTYCGHRFTDDEVAGLLGGGEIEVKGMVGKSGKPFDAKGHLEDQEFNGHKFVGFKITGFLDGGKAGGPPASWSGHKFTEDEIALLEMGKVLELTDLVSKRTGKPYKTRVLFGEVDGKKKIVPEFDEHFASLAP